MDVIIIEPTSVTLAQPGILEYLAFIIGLLFKSNWNEIECGYKNVFMVKSNLPKRRK